MQPLVDGPRTGLSEAEVLASLDPTSGNRVEWGVDVLDTALNETEETLPVDVDTGGTVRWSYRPTDRVNGSGTDVATTRRTASLTIVGDPGFNLLAHNYRIWMDLNRVRWHLGVFACSLPERRDDGRVVRQTLELADLTWRWRQRLMAEPSVVDADTDVLALISAEMQTLFGITPDFGGASALLDEPLFSDQHEAWTSRWNQLLQAVGYDQLIADEDGTPTAEPLADIIGREAELTFSPDGPAYSSVATSVSAVLPSIPNVVRFVARRGPTLPVEGNGWTERRNQSTGPASIDQRGEEVVEIVDVEASDQTVLEAVADGEAARWFAGGGNRIQIAAALHPRLSDRDVVHVTKPRLDLDADTAITGWEIPLVRMTTQQAALMNITAEEVIV